MRRIILKAGILLLFCGMTGCSVYHPESVSIDDGVNSQNRIKVTTMDNHVIELKELVREDGQLYGITGKKSETAKLLLDRPHIPHGNNVMIPFSDDEIKAVHLKNKKMSNIVNVGVPIVGAAGLLGIANKDFRPDVGN
ncbi:hypothetical protein SAMN06296241_1665 [Salinimicrobium sediminis]|uniref:Uncharacterized protein n=1 Tax=Salinimicrobium sediminis TaxID=1343891 RepID=A0A285X433_9FLAO|nr:hypothetical protein [Salinimicrobium sediminis]SOC80120.1 hypothetical protein SAMN06296241_1665 [Salinimicrobium sediminis]